MRTRTPIVWIALSLALAPVPAWLWWRQRSLRPVPLATGPEGIRLAPVAEPGPPGPAVERASGSGTEASPPAGAGGSRTSTGSVAAATADAAVRGTASAPDIAPADLSAVVAALGRDALRTLLAERLRWPRGPRLERLVEDWCDALALLRRRHREALGQHPLLQRLLRGPGDFLFELLPELVPAIREGRVTLVLPPAGSTPAGGAAGFRIDDARGRLSCEVPTGAGRFRLDFDERSGDPQLWQRLWVELGILHVFAGEKR